MGLTSYAQAAAAPVNGGNTDDWTLTGGSTAWEILAQPWETYTLRTTSGGVTTDPANDAQYIESLSGAPGVGQDDHHVVGPLSSLPSVSDHIAHLVFHARAMRVSGTKNLVLYLRRSTTNYSLGTITLTGGTTWTNYSVTAALDPSTNLAWDQSDFYTTDASAWSYGSTANEVGSLELAVGATGVLGSIRVSRVYVEFVRNAGPTDGRYLAYKNWRWCDICGLKRPYDRIQRPEYPHPQAGRAVCDICLDKPDHDTLKLMSQRPFDDGRGEEELY